MEKMKKMKIKRGYLLMTAGLLMIVAALFITAYNIYDDMRAGRAARSALTVLKDAEAEGAAVDSMTSDGTPLYKRYPNINMPSVEIDGKKYIGILNIPTLDIELPVEGEFSYKGLKTSPCRYSGSVYLNDMIIAGHNYNRHFGRLKNLRSGDGVSFTDADGNKFYYTVLEILQIGGTDVEGMTGGDWDMTLFTCTLDGRSRYAVRLISEDS